MANTQSRQAKRTPVTLKIKFKSETLDQFIERYSVDISHGGIFIRTKDPLAVGTTLKFEFQLKDASPLIRGEGTVVWTREHDPSRGGVAPGMGVRFDRLPPESQEVLDRILTQKAAQGGEKAKAGPGQFGDSPTRVAPAPLVKGLAASSSESGRIFGKAPKSGGFGDERTDATPLPSPMPFHTDAGDYSDDVFEEKTRVADLDALVHSTADPENSKLIDQDQDQDAGSDDDDEEFDEATNILTKEKTEAATAAAIAAASEAATKIARPPTRPAPEDGAPAAESAPTPAPDTPPAADSDSDSDSDELAARREAKGKVKPRGKEKGRRKRDRTEEVRAVATAAAEPEPRMSEPPRERTDRTTVPTEPKKGGGLGAFLLVAVLLLGVGGYVVFGMDVVDLSRFGLASDSPGASPAEMVEAPVTPPAPAPTPDPVPTSEPVAEPVAEPMPEPEPTFEPVKVVVKSKVKGAVATLLDDDTEQSGPTPLTLEGLNPDKGYVVEVSKPGFLSRKVEFEPGSEPVVVDLDEKPRVVVIASEPEGAAVVINGRTQDDVTPAEVPLEGRLARARSLRISVRKRGFRNANEVIVVRDATFAEADAAMKLALNLNLEEVSAVAESPRRRARDPEPSVAQQRPPRDTKPKADEPKTSEPKTKPDEPKARADEPKAKADEPREKPEPETPAAEPKPPAEKPPADTPAVDEGPVPDWMK